MKLFSKNSNLCDHNPPTLQTDGQTNRQTDRQTTFDRNTALCTKVHRAVKTKKTTNFLFEYVILIELTHNLIWTLRTTWLIKTSQTHICMSLVSSSELVCNFFQIESVLYVYMESRRLFSLVWVIVLRKSVFTLRKLRLSFHL